MRLLNSLFIVCAVLFGSNAFGQSKQFGTWSVGTMAGDEGIYAATVNDSQGVLGQYCYRDEGQCLWLLLSDIDCVEGNRYPTLVNSEAGASYMELLCIKLQQKPRYAFTKFDAIDNIVRNSSNIGIAFPMESGYFKVSRFNLNGAINALNHMRSKAEAFGSKLPGGTRDTKL